jgi:hypothetical protein
MNRKISPSEAREKRINALKQEFRQNGVDVIAMDNFFDETMRDTSGKELKYYQRKRWIVREEPETK